MESCGSGSQNNERQQGRTAPAPLILCIDDEPVGLRVRKILLEVEGFQVLTATGGPHGLELFAETKVDAVVLDYAMPAMNGGQVAKTMKELKPDVPIVLLSAYVDLPRDAVAHVDAVCVKGDHSSVLIAALRGLLSENNRAHG
jgi:CheY-like chemotaxis protein